MEIEILNVAGSKSLGRLTFSPDTSLKDVKKKVATMKGGLHVDRQSLRLEAKGKSLKDSDTLRSLGVKPAGKLYVKDLGPQISWKTVFLVEYAGPLVVYLWMYQRPQIFYGSHSAAPMSTVAM